MANFEFGLIFLTIMNLKIFNILAFALSVLNPFISIDAQQNDSIINRQVIFSDNFSKDNISKFPDKWISNRPGEVVTLKNVPGRWLKMHAEGTYLPQITQELPKNFTIEFDFIYQAIGNGNNTAELTIFSKPKGSANDDLFPGSSGIKIIFETFIVSCLCYDNLNPGAKVSDENRTKLIQANNIAKITIKVKQQQLHVFVNGFECLNIPNCNSSAEVFNAIRFYLWGSQTEPLVGNFRVSSD